jgi:hypothetical protein
MSASDPPKCCGRCADLGNCPYSIPPPGYVLMAVLILVLLALISALPYLIV